MRIRLLPIYETCTDLLNSPSVCDYVLHIFRIRYHWAYILKRFCLGCLFAVVWKCWIWFLIKWERRFSVQLFLSTQYSLLFMCCWPPSMCVRFIFAFLLFRLRLKFSEFSLGKCLVGASHYRRRQRHCNHYSRCRYCFPQ